MIKLLIGGSPCTHWSIAQKNNRETKPEGLGWELFLNYLIAKEKFKPDFFLYENNKSAAQAIKDKIAQELGVGTDAKARFTYINSSLVSAQNRQRFYVTNFGDIEQPEDRGILLKDILEDSVTDKNKAYRLKHQAGNARDYFKKHHTNVKFEPANITNDGKSQTIKNVGDCETVQKAIPKLVDKHGCVPEMFNAYNRQKVSDKSPTLSTGSMVTSSCATNRFESIYGYAMPCEWDENGIPIKAISCAEGKVYTVYEVKDGLISIKDKQYPIKLKDGYYIIRKLTVKECCRLQTMPDNYCKAVSDTQAYKALGNGWTAEVIIHLLNHALKDVPKDEEIIVLSMYDGIGTGRYCLDKMGFTNVKYYAYEIDKYPIAVASDNYPDIIHCGDAFKIREERWSING